MSRSSSSSGSADSVFVFGSTGTIGNAILKQIHEVYPNVRVKAQCRDNSKGDQIRSGHPKAEVVNFDFDQIEVGPLRGSTSLFLLSPYSVDMLVQVRQIVDAAKEAGVRHIVHLGVHQPKKTKVNYVHWHALCEKYIESSGMTWTHLRPNMFYENLVDYSGMKAIQGDQASFPLQPQTKLAWVAACDIARVAAKCLVEYPAHSNQIYPITSSICTLQDLISAIKQSVPQLKNLKLNTPSVDETYQQLLSVGAEPVYMKGFRDTVLECNQMGDCSSIPGAKEGLEVVRNIGGQEPTKPEDWAPKQSWGQ